MSRRFVAAGHELAPRLQDAELHVINSCTVTHLAARTSRKTARRGHRLDPAMRTVLTGCYATGSPEEAAALAGVDLVVTNEHKDELVERVHAAFPEAIPSGSAALDIPYVPLDFGLSRALVKVEDGCNMRCSFCIIPLTRGRQRSRTVQDVVEEVRSLAAGGYPEVVVTGVQISEYRDGDRRLFDLVAALLEQTDVRRLRLTSIAPWKFDRRLLSLWQDERLCRHVHMSLQSGCTETLRRMRRPYSAAQYAELAEELRQAIPNLALTTDVIVGFPGETDAEFEASLHFVEELKFAKPHIFTYSPRDGTRAAGMSDQVEPQTKKQRVAAMLAVAEASERDFAASQIGEASTVVWEERKSSPDGLGRRWTGLTDHYVRVWAEPEDTDNLSGRLERVRLTRAVVGGAMAERLAA
ncbi:MAG: MiaB/RimO family radical SAM methylthiotransferase [Thermoanaerobaculia bacterium]|nr:MiaB/RimO family radical SAM methylthiotransferase [Thermoanaerobaculia bacterium]